MTGSLSLQDRVERIVGERPGRMTALSGGCIAEIYRADFDLKPSVVVKRGANLDLEGWMLSYLKEHSALPVPDVLLAEPDILVLSYIETSGTIDVNAERHAADLLAALHEVRNDRFGLERNTLIGSLHQPNPPTDRWIDFFRDHRLLYMAGTVLEAGALPRDLMPGLEAVAARLGDWIDEPIGPSLIHGDMWGGNVLTNDGRIAAFIDPAIYFADAEIELAFSTLFGTFGDAFFARYHERRPIAPGFFEVRRDLYNLYPLLVHVRLFGGGYVGQVRSIVKRLVG